MRSAVSCMKQHFFIVDNFIMQTISDKIIMCCKTDKGANRNECNNY